MDDYHNRFLAQQVSDIELQGFLAAVEGRDCDANPYAADCWEHQAWGEGFAKGHAFAARHDLSTDTN